jgi:hypothetical protein
MKWWAMLLLCSACHAEICRVDGIEPILEEIEHCHPNALLILDVHRPDCMAKAREKGVQVMIMTPQKDLVPQEEELASGKFYTYAKGVIRMRTAFKGMVLQEVFSKLQELPAQVLMVDGALEQVQSVDQACQNEGVPCTAFHFLAREL